MKIITSCLPEGCSYVELYNSSGSHYAYLAPPCIFCENSHISSSNLINIWCLVSVNPLPASSQTHPQLPLAHRHRYVLCWGPSGWLCICLMQLDHPAVFAVTVESRWMPCRIFQLSAHNFQCCKGLWVLCSSEECVSSIIISLQPSRFIPCYPPLQSRLKK